MNALPPSGPGPGPDFDAPPDAPGSQPAPVGALPARRAERREAAAKRKRRRRRLLIAAPFLGLLSWLIVSYAIWMLEPTSLSWNIRSVEWVRADVPFGNWMVDNIEQTYYTANAPKKGGRQLKRLPAVGLNLPRINPIVKARQPVVGPPPIKPVFAQPLPGEGIWKPTGPPVNGGPPVLLTTFRPEVEYPEIVAYVAWFDHTRTQMAYYPGRYEPPRAAVRGPLMVPNSQRWRLLAAFNSGFIAIDGNNGSTDNGRVNEPLTDGNATLVGYRDSRIDIVKWSGGSNAGPDVAWTRQSLRPIVWNRSLNPNLNADPNSPEWGYSLGSATRVWRTGIGIDAHGNLFFVAANDQTVITLAKILQHIGAVRAMEFDINPEWHTLITYTHSHGLVPRLVEPQPNQSVDRYLVPDDRDFFAVYQRLPGPVTVPFK